MRLWSAYSSCVVSSDWRARKRRDWNVCTTAGSSQSHQDVHDHCNDLQRRMAALPTQSHRTDVWQHPPLSGCVSDSQSSVQPVIYQLVYQPDRLRAHVETFSSVTHSGQTKFFYMTLWSLFRSPVTSQADTSATNCVTCAVRVCIKQIRLSLGE